MQGFCSLNKCHLFLNKSHLFSDKWHLFALNPTILKITPGSNKFDGRYVEEKIVSSIL